jgi:GDP-mannose 6-dehydrogenase
VRLAESLIGKGVPLRIFDPDVTLSQVFGRNEAYIQEHIPHVAQLMGDSFNEVVRGADVVIVGKHVRGVKTLKSVLRSDQIVIDLVGIRDLGAAIRPWAALCSTASV